MSKVEIEKRGRVVKVHARLADVLVARGGYMRRDMVACAAGAAASAPAATAPHAEVPPAKPAKKAAKPKKSNPKKPSASPEVSE